MWTFGSVPLKETSWTTRSSTTEGKAWSTRGSTSRLGRGGTSARILCSRPALSSRRWYTRIDSPCWQGGRRCAAEASARNRNLLRPPFPCRLLWSDLPEIPLQPGPCNAWSQNKNWRIYWTLLNRPNLSCGFSTLRLKISFQNPSRLCPSDYTGLRPIPGICTMFAECYKVLLWFRTLSFFFNNWASFISAPTF